ncbi:MAG: type II secretion system protein [Acidiferrobacterales bacterium]
MRQPVAPDAGKRSGSSGFTLLEVLVALAIVVLVMALMYPDFDQAIQYLDRVKTESHLQALSTAITDAYTDNAMNVDTAQGPDMCLDAACTQTFATGVAASVTNPASTAQSGFDYLPQTTGHSALYYALDGFHRPLQVYVSAPLQASWDGYTVHYRAVAFVSSAGKQSLNPGTKFNAATGVLTLGQGDMGIVVSGLPIEIGLYQQTLARMQSVAQAYSAFFTARYLGSTSRDMSVDYFSAADTANPVNSQEFDPTSPIGNSGNNNGNWAYTGWPYPGDAASPLVNWNTLFSDCQPAMILSGFETTLGLSTAQLTSGWGEPLGVCNGPNADGQGGYVRNPSNGNTALDSPPYTAEIASWAPDGVPLTVSITGSL